MNKPELIKTYEKDFAKPVQILSEAQKRQAEIDAEKELFFANGGKVTEIDSCSFTPTIITSGKHEGKKRKQASMNSKFYPTSHDYVYRSDADSEKFVVIIGAFISMQFDHINKAVNCRDFKLAGR